MKTKGTIETINISPKGFREGLLLKTDHGIIQINLPKDHQLALELETGGHMAAEVEPEEPRGEPQHPVYRLLHLTNGNGKALPPDSRSTNRFSGRIERLNYALHGEVNGGMLDSGDFLHLKPEGARAAGIEVGMDVSGHGKRKPMADGHFVIEAEEVNGILIEVKGKKKLASKHAQRG